MYISKTYYILYKFHLFLLLSFLYSNWVMPMLFFFFLIAILCSFYFFLIQSTKKISCGSILLHAFVFFMNNNNQCKRYEGKEIFSDIRRWVVYIISFAPFLHCLKKNSQKLASMCHLWLPAPFSPLTNTSSYNPLTEYIERSERPWNSRRLIFSLTFLSSDRWGTLHKILIWFPNQ